MKTDRVTRTDGEVRSAVVQRASERVRGPDTKQCNYRMKAGTRLLRLRRELVKPPPASQHRLTASFRYISGESGGERAKLAPAAQSLHGRHVVEG